MVQNALRQWYTDQNILLNAPPEQMIDGIPRKQYIDELNRGKRRALPIFAAYDKFKHCFVSCMVARKHGNFSAWTIGYGHERINGGYDEADIRANEYGIQCAGEDRMEKSDEQDCLNKCSRKYAPVYLWPRYPG